VFIKTYMKNMKMKMKDKENGSTEEPGDEVVVISQGGMKRFFMRGQANKLRKDRKET
jgi:hypothetical protein